jgi:hypothetical protein
MRMLENRMFRRMCKPKRGGGSDRGLEKVEQLGVL